MDEITRLEKDSILYYQGGGADIALGIDKRKYMENMERGMEIAYQIRTFWNRNLKKRKRTIISE